MASVMSLPAESAVHSSSSSARFAGFLAADLKLDLSSAEDKNCAQEDNNFLKPSTKRHKLGQELTEELEPTKLVEDDKSEVVTLQKDVCPPHPGFIGGRCFLCEQLEDNKSGEVALGYIHKGLRMTSMEIDRFRRADLYKLLGVRTEEEKKRTKLVLILDLDHTLLNSTLINRISSEEEYLIHKSESMESDPSTRCLFKFDRMHMLTKLRPFVRTFLQEASSMFEMYIYTMAEPSYAREIAKILDPDNVYFDRKVISKSDSTSKNQKGLDIVLAPECAVMILDDTESVWRMENRQNLIQMERYHYFSSSCRQFGINAKSLAELKIDEREKDGALANILNILKQAREMFFETDDNSSKDVRKILKSIRKETLKGCKIVFSRVFPANTQAEYEPIWEMAQQLGAICSTVLDLSVTHVVSVDKYTVKARWAVKNGKFLVTPRWIEAANFLWKRQPEKNFEIRASSKIPATATESDYVP